eukprot:6084801-Lingulodinium_polyedra.AAC.1
MCIRDSPRGHPARLVLRRLRGPRPRRRLRQVQGGGRARPYSARCGFLRRRAHPRPVAAFPQ